MIEVFELREAIPPQFHPLALPESRHLLQSRPPSLMAVGASQAGQPVGLALANRQAVTQTANLLSVVVQENERRQGIGKALLQGLDIVLQRQGCRAVFAEFVTDAEAGQSSAEAAFLQASGFAAPRPGIHIWSGSLQIARDVLWLDRCKLTADFSLSTWASLTSAEREELRQGEGVWYPPIFSPFLEEAAIDPERSLLLRYKEEVVGWMIVELFDAETVLFKTMFVHRRHQRTGRGIALMAESWKRLLQDEQFRNGIFFVEAENQSMVRFLNTRFSIPAIQKQILWRTYKSI